MSDRFGAALHDHQAGTVALGGRLLRDQTRREVIIQKCHGRGPRRRAAAPRTDPHSFETLQPRVEVFLVFLNGLLRADEADEVWPLRVLEDDTDEAEVRLFR